MRLTLTTLLLLCFVTLAHAQPSVKDVKKQITVQGVKAVSAYKHHPNLFFYHTNDEQGIWDHSTQKVVIKGRSPVKIHPTRQGPFLVFNKQSYGFVSPGFNPFIVNSSAEPKKDSSIFMSDTLRAAYNAGMPRLEVGWYNKEYNEYEWFYDIMRWDDHLVVQAHEGRYSHTEVFQLNDTSYVKPIAGKIYKRSFGWFSVIQDPGRDFPDKYSYYDKGFDPIREYTYPDSLSLEDIQAILSPAIELVDHAGDGLYIFKRQAFYGILDMRGMTTMLLQANYNRIFPAGGHQLMEGRTFYLLKDSKVGIINNRVSTMLEPRYKRIRMVQTASGAYAVHADNELYEILPSKGAFAYNLVKTALGSTPVLRFHQLSTCKVTEDNKLLVSLGQVRLDRGQYGPIIKRLNGSGVFDLRSRKWQIEPKYHNIFTFRKHIIAGIGEGEEMSYQILDRQFQPVVDRTFKYAFQMNGMLFVVGEKGLQRYHTKEGEFETVLDALTDAKDLEVENGYAKLGIRASAYRVPLRFWTWTLMDSSGQVIDGDYSVEQVLPGGFALVTQNSGNIGWSEPWSVLDLKENRVLLPWCFEMKYEDGVVRYKESSQDEAYQESTLTTLRSRDQN